MDPRSPLGAEFAALRERYRKLKADGFWRTPRHEHSGSGGSRDDAPHPTPRPHVHPSSPADTWPPIPAGLQPPVHVFATITAGQGAAGAAEVLGRGAADVRAVHLEMQCSEMRSVLQNTQWRAQQAEAQAQRALASVDGLSELLAGLRQEVQERDAWLQRALDVASAPSSTPRWSHAPDSVPVGPAGPGWLAQAEGGYLNPQSPIPGWMLEGGACQAAAPVFSMAPPHALPPEPAGPYPLDFWLPPAPVSRGGGANHGDANVARPFVI